MPHLKHSNNLSTSSIVVVVLDFDPIFSLTVFFFFFLFSGRRSGKSCH